MRLDMATKEKDVNVSVRNLDQDVPSAENSRNINAQQPKWHPGYKRRFPWLGIGSLFVVLVCAGLVVVVLTTSDNKAREDWPGEYLKGNHSVHA